MLLAGGCANDANTLGGSLVFNVLNNQIKCLKIVEKSDKNA